MAKDDFDKNELEEGNDPVERDTEVTSPPDRLLQESRRSHDDTKKEDPAVAPTPFVPPSHDARKPRREIQSRSPSQSSPSIRLGSIPSPSPRKTNTTVIVIGAGVVAFLLGFVPLNIYHERQDAALYADISDAQEQLNICNANAEKCVDVLSECIRDFDTLSGTTAPLGLAPRDFLVEKKRNKKTSAALALSEKQDRILGHLEAMRKPKDRSRKRWKELHNDVVLFRNLIAAKKIADKEYQTALKISITPAVGAADVAMTTRNRKRADYLNDAKSILTSSSTDLKPSAP